ncbi:MAG: efflux RND transporter permease subunit, partial [Candidatus Sumerlaeia bacterium]
LPLALFIIFMILFFLFRSTAVSAIVFSGVAVAWSGGFILLWLYGQRWFMDFSIFGANLRETFQVKPINLSVAIWVGFLALFGIATDAGVVIASYIRQRLELMGESTRENIRAAILEAGRLRILPCMMTTATTILALLPVLTSTGRGSDILVPMAIPVFGGMLLQVFTTLVVPVLYCLWEEFRLLFKKTA